VVARTLQNLRSTSAFREVPTMLLSDLRFAWRTLWLRQNRAFTLATVLTFALGIGAATAIFSIVHAVMLAPLPYQGADRVMRLNERNLSRGFAEFSVSTPNFQSWVERADTFDSLAALRGESVNLGADGRYERVPGLGASASLWRVLGMSLVAGRPFTEAEDTLGGPAVAIMGEGIWRTHFGADPALVGRTIQVNGEPRTVVGIAPQDVGFATDIAIWLPLTPDPESYGRGDRRLDVLGRLRDDVTQLQAKAQIDSISAALATEFPDSNAGWDAVVQPIRDWIVGGQARQRLLVLLAAVVVLMLVACTNVANLQIARATARQREMGVRQALGAARSRLVGQMVAENALLAAVGGALGLLLAWAAIQAAVACLPASTPRLAAYAVDWRAAVLAIAVATLTAVAFGLAPALVAMRKQLAHVLQQVGRSTVDAQRGPMRQILVVVQFALATVLVIASALLAQHLARLQRESPGFRPDQILVGRLTIPQENENVDTTPHLQLWDRMLAEIRALPGVASAGITSEIPLGEVNTSMMVAAGAGTALTYEQDSMGASWRIVSGDYLATLGVPLLRGRTFAADNEGFRNTILSEGLVKRLWPDGEDPIGQTIRLGNGQTRTVIGVAGDVRQLGLGEAPTPTMYFPTTWTLWPTMTLVVRADGDPAALIASIREVAQRVSPEYPMFDLRTMGTVVSASVAEPRVQSMVLIAFAVSSLLLAAFGVAGVMADLVARRTPELAVRMALGASPGRMVGHVLGRGSVLCVAGVAAGSLVLASLSGAWREVAAYANVPAMQALGAAVLLAVGLLACWLPARRVARIAPSIALRDE
jgi:putative ABC transport system permease protein